MEKQELPKIMPPESRQLCETNRIMPLDHYTPKASQLILKNCTSVATACKTHTPSLARLRKEYSPEKIHALVASYLIDFSLLLGLKRPLNEVQIEFIANEIVTNYWYFTIADINVIFRRAKSGYYGEFYESVNPPKILTWFSQYESEKDQHCIDVNINESSRLRGRDERRGQSFESIMKNFKTNK